MLNIVWILIAVLLPAGHFVFILKNSSSLIPTAVLRGPWFQQSASGCTMIFWWESNCSLASTNLHFSEHYRIDMSLHHILNYFICRFTFNFRPLQVSVSLLLFFFFSFLYWCIHLSLPSSLISVTHNEKMHVWICHVLTVLWALKVYVKWQIIFPRWVIGGVLLAEKCLRYKLNFST